MWRLIATGLLYLFGSAIILVIRPTLMFTEDGSWKEFGIGRSKNTHTWMPFWLFSILWALVSYILMNIIFAVYYPDKSPQVRHQRLPRGKSIEMPDGYYIKNTSDPELSGGVPKYIYLGKGLPED